MKKTIALLGVLTMFVSFATPAFAYAKRPTRTVKHPVVQPVIKPVVQPVVTPVIQPATTTFSWGAFPGNNDAAMTSFENMVGAKGQVTARFSNWQTMSPSSIAGSQGKTLLVFWEPWVGYDQINNGSKDAYIKQFALSQKAYGYPIILAPFPEFNLNETPWGIGVGTNTAEGFKAAWKRIVDIYRANGVTNVKFAMAYNNDSIPAAPYAKFYPGNDYVDIVGIDGFNFGTQNFSSVFSKALTEANTFGKPVWILSTGSVSNKSQFITDLGASKYPFVWFNQSPFDIDSSALTAFKTIIK